MLQQPTTSQASSLPRTQNDTQTHHSRQDSCGRLIGPSQRPISDSRQPLQQTAIHALGEIGTLHSNKQAAADPILRPRGQWERQLQSHEVFAAFEYYLPSVIF
jgi:hypothetical protein